MLLGAIPAPALTLTEADVCVYGGTSGGVAAAVQAARLGKRTVLIEPGRHLGGMTSSGLGVTDIGPHGRDFIGGVSREFYRRVGAKYGKAEEVWFEPKIAEQVFAEMAAEAGVMVVFGESLAGVEKTGATLARLNTSAGRVVRAGMFIDATYEGDLLAAAGVRWVIGREANAQFGESLNGVRPPTPLISGRRLDPYVEPGVPTSGLIALVRPGPAGAVATADELLQAYNYRLCLTNVPANRVPIEPPPDYDPAQHELLARYIQSGPAPGKPAGRAEAWVLDDLIDVQTLLPNGKADINAGCPVSTDFHRGNDGYVTATPAGRAAIAKAHENHIRGLLHFLRTDPRVPVNVREEMASWGLARDEFGDHGHWPRQLYVREARRMVGDFVMTDRHGRGLETAPQGIGLAAYWLDSHSYQLLEIGGEVRHEGGFFTNSPLYPPRPFPIAFRSIVAKKSEVTNLAAPFCLSATHACFSSLRMEPVFMITSQAAASAAALALEAGTAIQDVPYDRLQSLLQAEGQILSLAPPPVSDGSVIVDTENTDRVTVTGAWPSSTSVPGYQGAGYLTDGNSEKGAKSVVFRPILPLPGEYRVAVAYRAFSNRAGAVPLALRHAGGTTDFVIDQRIDAGPWKELGLFSFEAEAAAELTIGNAGTEGFVVADAARWVPVVPPPPPPPEIAVLAADPAAAEAGDTRGRFVISRGFKVATALTVGYAISGTATPGDDFVPLASTVTIPANAVSASVTVTSLPDARVEGDETIVLTLEPAEAYAAKPGFQSASVVIEDTPFDAWRAASFPPTQAEDNAVAGPTADPDSDGANNLVEWALGTPPTTADAPGVVVAWVNGPLSTTVSRRRDVPVESLAWEMSVDGVQWRTPVPAPELQAVEEIGPALDRLTWRWPGESTAQPSLMLRLRVSL
jgi:hypothetical protein